MEEDILKKILNLNLNNSSTMEVSRLLGEFGDLPATQAMLNAGTIIMRARMGRGYDSVCQLSYRNAEYCHSFQRASIPGMTAFYGCIADDIHHQENARLICLCECSNLHRKTEESGREYITCSAWRTTRPLKVLSFITDKTFSREHHNKMLDYFRAQYKKNRNKLSSEQYQLSEFINHEWTKDVTCEKDYLITATIAYDMFYRLEEYNYDAIVYPSVQTGGQAGVDIAIKPEVVDEALVLDRIIEQSHYKIGDKSLLIIDRGYDAMHNRLPNKVTPPAEICNQLGIVSINELKIIKH